MFLHLIHFTGSCQACFRKPESAKFLKEKCETVNDPIFSSRIAVALTHVNHLDLANQVVASNQLESGVFKACINFENSLERCDKMLQFAIANPRLNIAKASPHPAAALND